MAGTTPRTIALQQLTVDVSLSGVAQGDLFYRGASTWNNLAAGTSGYYLKSNGAGADPSWASVSVSPAGSSGQLQWNSSSSFAGAAYLNYATSGSILTITDGIGDEFWHFAHSRWEKPAKRYMTLLYTFEAEAPFRVRRIIPAPILTADPRTNVGEDPNYCPVVFPCGAEPIHRDDGTVSHWLVTHGVHDRYTEIHRWDHADLESRLIPVRTGYRQRRVIEPMGEYI